MTCAADGCTVAGKLRRALCAKHYYRVLRSERPRVQRPRVYRPARFWKHVLVTDTCWLWTGPLNTRGYGTHGGKPAHRSLFLRLVGPIRPDLELDHLCRVRNCVRPDHLEPVTHAENVRRAYAASAPQGVTS
jgi:hypothetical protein